MESKGELFAAFVRVIPAAVIIFSGWISLDAGQAGHPLVMVGVFYIIVSLIGILLAIIGYFRLWLPYFYVLADTAAIAFALTMLAKMHHLDLVHEFSMPIFSLIYVVLAHSALRYRPALVLFSTCAFLTLLLIFPYVVEGNFTQFEEKNIFLNLDNMLHDIGYLPILFLVLTTVLLFLIVRRTRELATTVLLYGHRTGQLSRFFSPDIVQKLLSSNGEYGDFRDHQSVAVVFIDIRGFSSFSEKNTPQKTAEVLEKFRTKVCETIFSHGGTVDKFIGDAVLAVFGTPVSKPDDASRAVEAIREINEKFNSNPQPDDTNTLSDIKVGIGGHFGEVFAGIIESGKIIEHTVLGTTVNVAQRLERQTRQLGADYIISHELKAASNLCETGLGLKFHENGKLPGHVHGVDYWISKP